MRLPRTRRTADPSDGGVNRSLPSGSTTDLLCGGSGLLSCGESDPITGAVCTKSRHSEPLHRDVSDEAFEFIWGDL